MLKYPTNFLLSILVAGMSILVTDMVKPLTKDPVLLLVQGFKGGVATAWLRNADKNIDAGLKFPMLNLVKREAWICGRLGIDGMCDRKGSGDNISLTPLGTDAPRRSKNTWRMIPMILGKRNTPEGRLEAAMMLVTYFNIQIGNPTVRNVRYGGDLTAAPMSAMDAAFLDCDVFSYMMFLHPDMHVGDHTDDAEFMSIYWTDVERGARYMNESQGL